MRSTSPQKNENSSRQQSPGGLYTGQPALQEHNSPSPAHIAESPFVVAQRTQIDSTFGPVIQPQSENRTGLPNHLKSGVESLSGMSLDSVRVHYNSNKPAQLQALAYAQGTDIHVAPGQEKHLPHEAWHVVQQAQGRVRPTMQMKSGAPVNNDRGLENEADKMGTRALNQPVHNSARGGASAELNTASSGKASPIQRKPPDDPHVFNFTDSTDRVWSRDNETDEWFREGLDGRLPWTDDHDQNRTSSEFLSEHLETSIDEDRSHPIPQTIHRFWSGGKFSKDAMNNLMDSAQKTQGTDWDNQLWHSSSLEGLMAKHGLVSPKDIELRDAQRDQLRLHGYNIRTIEELAEQEPPEPSGIDKMLGLFSTPKPLPKKSGSMSKGDIESMSLGAAGKLSTGSSDKWDGIKHMSDMARLMYLHQVGGHHFDVDMGLGEMDLSRQYYHNDPQGLVPLMGSLAVTGEDPIAEHVERTQSGGGRDHDFNDPGVADSAGKVAQQASGMSHMLNGMIATRRQNPNVALAIDTLRGDAVKNIAHTTGMMGNEKLLVGNSKRSDLSQKQWNTKKKQTVPPYILDLQHFTDESGNR